MRVRPRLGLRLGLGLGLGLRLGLRLGQRVKVRGGSDGLGRVLPFPLGANALAMG